MKGRGVRRSLFCSSWIGVLFYACALCISISAADALPTKGREWILIEQCPDSGVHTLYISREAAKIVSHKYGYEVSTSAPTWLVHCYRPKEKVEWVTNLSTFNGKLLMSPFADCDANLVPMSVSQKGKMNGLKYTQYLEVRNPQSVMRGADEISVVPEIAEFVCRYFYVPDIPKIPLYRRNNRGYGQPKINIGESWRFTDIGKDTRVGMLVELSVKSWRTVTLNPIDFTPPKGYRRVNTPGQASYSTGQKEGLSDMLTGIGLSSEVMGKKEKSSRHSKPAPTKP